MLHWAIIFLIISIIADVSGFTGVAIASAGVTSERKLHYRYIMDHQALLLSLKVLLLRNDLVLVRNNDELNMIFHSIVSIFLEHTKPKELINGLTDEEVTHLLHLMDIGLGDYEIVIDCYAAIINKRAKLNYQETMLPGFISTWKLARQKMHDAFQADCVQKNIQPQIDPFHAEQVNSLFLIDSETSQAVPLNSSAHLKQCYLQMDDPLLKEKLTQCAKSEISVLRLRMKRRIPIPVEIGQMTTLRVLDLYYFDPSPGEKVFPKEIVNLTSIPVLYRCILRNILKSLKTGSRTRKENRVIDSQTRILQDWIDVGTVNTPYWQNKPITVYDDVQRFHLGQGHPILVSKEIQAYLITLFPQALKLWAAEVETANRDPILLKSKRLVLYFRTSAKLFNLLLQAYHLAYSYPDDPMDGDLFQRKLLISLYHALKVEMPELFLEAKNKLNYEHLENLFINGKVVAQEWSQKRPSWKKSAFKFFSAWTPNTATDEYPVSVIKVNRASIFSRNAHC